jgi:hypothetical protein
MPNLQGKTIGIPGSIRSAPFTLAALRSVPYDTAPVQPAALIASVAVTVFARLKAVPAHPGPVQLPDQLPALFIRIQVYQSIAIPATVTILLLANPDGCTGGQPRHGHEVMRSHLSGEVADENYHAVI